MKCNIISGIVSLRFSEFAGYVRATMILLLLGLSSTQVLANYAQRSDVQIFINEMVSQYHFNRAQLTQQFSQAKRLDNVLVSIAKPAEKTLTWKQYRPIFLGKNRIRKGREFLIQNHDALERAERKYGVPAEIVAAIIGVETYFGRQTGKYTVFDSLTTLAFDYPPRKKFFRNELKQFLLLSREEHINIKDMTGSYAGALGVPQFISSSYRHYAVDFDGDGVRDLWHSLPDVIGSVAHYFSGHGWRQGKPVVYRVQVDDTSIVPEKNRLKPYATVKFFRQHGVHVDSSVPDSAMATLLKLQGSKGTEYWLGLHNFYVITRYNHSELYAMAVYQLSQKLIKH